MNLANIWCASLHMLIWYLCIFLSEVSVQNLWLTFVYWLCSLPMYYSLTCLFRSPFSIPVFALCIWALLLGAYTFSGIWLLGKWSLCYYIILLSSLIMLQSNLSEIYIAILIFDCWRDWNRGSHLASYLLFVPFYLCSIFFFFIFG